MVQAFLKKWWVESDFKAPNLSLSLRLKGSGCHYNSIYNNTGTNRYNSSQRSTKFSEEGGTSVVNHLHQQPRVTWIILTTKVNIKNTFTSHIDKNIFLTFWLTSLSLYIFTIWKSIVYYRLCIPCLMHILHCPSSTCTP